MDITSITNLRISACERLFSSSGYTVNSTRAAFSLERVASLVCLRDWLKTCNEC